jgi:DNA processing protein
MNRRVITPPSDEWPPQLTELGPERPPDHLFVDGIRLDARSPMVAVVGARRPTVAGIEAATKLASGLAQGGFTVVSGLAVGIDAVAHKAALDSGGRTVAVLGCGLDVEYPSRNRALKRRIIECGTVVTEYPNGTPPHARHFPQRNRLIAGLAAGVVYVEGAEKSGGRITARQALDANRAVFAVPGSVRNPLGAGPNELIRTSQAALVTDVSHIFEELAPGLVWDRPWEPALEGREVALDEAEAQVLGFLDDVPTPSDRICTGLEVSSGRLALTLARLEVRGLVTRRPTGYEISSAGSRLKAGLAAAEGALA